MRDKKLQCIELYIMGEDNEKCHQGTGKYYYLYNIIGVVFYLNASQGLKELSHIS